MSSTKLVAEKKKSNYETPKKTQSSLSNREKNDLEQKIKSLESENKRLISENVMFKKNFDLRKIINELSPKGVTEWDQSEIAKDTMKLALLEAEERHEAEKKDMKKKHAKEIEQLGQKHQGAEQQQDLFTLKKTDELLHKQEIDITNRQLATLTIRTQNTISITVNAADMRETTGEIVEAKSAKTSIEAEKQKLEAEVKKLQNENKEQKHLYEESKDLLENARKALAEEKQNFEAEIKKLQNANKGHDSSKDLVEKEKRDLLSDKQKLEADITRLQDELKALKQSKEKNKRLNENEPKTLITEKQKLAAEEQMLQNENKEQNQSHEKSKVILEKEKSTLLADKQKMDAEIKRLQDENKALKQSEEKNKSLNEKLMKEEEAKENLNQQIQVLQKENNELKYREKSTLQADQQKMDTEIKRLQDEIKALKQSEEKNKSLNEKLKKEEEAKDNLSQQIQVLQKENNELKYREKSTLQADKQKMDAEIKRLQEEIKALKQSEEKNKSLNEKLKKVEEAKDNLNQQMQALQKENNELKYRLKESQSPPLSKVISANDNKTVEQLRVENERLRSRLSELAGAQMTHNNPNIADLSDVFRPTKLSEEYSQLYDNMWTDAFEEHNSKKEEDVIQMLRKGLLGSYEFCENVCKEFTVQLTNSTIALPNSMPKNRLQDIPIVYQKQLQDMKKSFGVFLMNDVKESYQKKQNSIEGGENTKKYIDACVELCWLMVIQDPPVVIETPVSKDSAFDTNTYRAYTTTGPKVDFVVWPALRLHHGGPLLAKGVAQGKN